MHIHPDCEKILFGEKDIQRQVNALAACLDKDYRDRSLLVICILKGSMIFFSDLIRRMRIPLSVDFMKVSSYGNTAVSGELHVKQELCGELTDKDVLIVEDIVDSGKTLSFLQQYFSDRGARSVKTVALLRKRNRRQTALKIDYTCFDVEDEFTVGYGMDYAERYRNLPYIAVLKREIYEKSL